jgi:LysM repeat protein
MSRLRFLMMTIALAVVLAMSGASSIFGDPTTNTHPNIRESAVGALFSPITQFGGGTATCTTRIEQAINTVGDACETLGRNQACYGNQMIDTRFRSDINIQDVVFRNSGDIADLSTIQRISTSAYSDLMGTWGIAVLKAQANLPGSLPGQNVIFLLYGDTTVDNPTADMRAVTIRTRVGGMECDELPDSALVIQSPQGRRVTLTINGAEVVLGSTARFTAEQNREMSISTIEGTAIVTVMDVERVVEPGAEVVIPLGGEDGLTVDGEPSLPRAYNREEIERIPLDLLDDEIEIPDPIVVETTEEPPTPVDTDSSGGTDGACVVRADWTQRYIVQPGDTLSSIAARVGVSVNELQIANCILDAARIFAGQILAVPRIIPTLPPPTQQPVDTLPPESTNIPAVSPVDPVRTATPIPIYMTLTANPALLPPIGGCFVLSWTVQGPGSIRAILNGVDVGPIGSKTECIQVTTTYVLVGYFNGGTQQSSTSLTVIVQSIIS